MFQTIVFDLDGTLLDTLDDITDAVNDSLALFNLPPYHREQVKKMVGDGSDKLIERALAPFSLGQEQKAAYKIAYLDKYERYQKNKTKPYPDVEDMMIMARRRSIRLFVLSNKPDFLTQEVVRHFFKDVTFAGILGQKKGAMPKPNPDALLNLLKEHQVDFSTTVFVGDSDVDIQTAKNAGLASIGVTWGFRDRQTLLAAHADYIVDEPEEIYDLCIDKRKFCL